MEIVILDLALLEIEDAILYYEDQLTSLGKEFYKEVFETFDVILCHPNAWKKIGKQTRKCLLKRFPYFVFYIVENNQITITAVGHQHRDPEYFVERIF
jgi:toxin ParE2